MGSLRKKQYTRPLPANTEFFQKKGQQFARWKDCHGRKKTALTKTSNDGTVRIVVESGKWLAKYRDGKGVIREVATGCKDKQAANAVLAELERRSELVRSGVLMVDEDALVEHAATLLVDHFDAYHQHRVALERNRTRIKNTDSRLQRLAEECGFRRLTDFSGEALTKWLGLQLDVGMGAGTRNEYLKELVGFSNWCIRTGRLTSNPFSKIPRANVKADCRRKRRALAEDELEKLLHVARWRPLAEYGRETVWLTPPGGSKRSRWKKAPITYDTLVATVTRARRQLAGNLEFAAKLDQRGRERALVYRTLVLTGLRRGELASLQVGSLELDGPSPYAMLSAKDEKNGQGSEIPLRSDLVVQLRQWVEAKRESFTGDDDAFRKQPLFAVPASLLQALNRDIAAAGIPKTDHRGRTVDVHAMRMTLATMLNKSGVAPRTAQEIMRHSDIRLTMETYTDAKLLNVSGALNSLPGLSSNSSTEVEPNVVQATGTETVLPPILPPNTVQGGLSESSTVTLTGNFGIQSPESSDSEGDEKPTKKGLSEGNSDKPCESGRPAIGIS